jgi:flagellar motor protein MotB
MLEGHADPQEVSAGDPLSWRLAYGRAEGVARFLTDKDVDPAHITLSSRGEQEPLKRESSTWARARNRRVVLWVY